MSTFQQRFQINGVVDTAKGVLTNIETLAKAASSWITFDTHTGQWAVVINRVESPIWYFDNSNIIGGINIKGSGLTEFYNSVELEYSHRDILDQKDVITYSIDVVDRFPNEINNKLDYKIDCINDPIQAELLAATELKQSRVDKIIEFRTDYSKLGIRAGDVIAVTAEPYSYVNKAFRVLNVVEEDSEDNSIVLSITAFEYDAEVYNNDDLFREIRTSVNGIIDQRVNTTKIISDQSAAVPISLTATAAAVGGLALIQNTNPASSEVGKFAFALLGKKVQTDGATKFIKIIYNFTDGSDLDTRTRLENPNAGQTTVDNYLGYTGAVSTSDWPESGTPYLEWGGDNTGVGSEQVLFNVTQAKTVFPSKRYFVLELRGNWYGTKGFNPINISAELYVSGTRTLDRAGTKAITVTGFTDKKVVTGLDVYVTSTEGAGPPETGATTLGNLIAYFVFDSTQNTGQFFSTAQDLVDALPNYTS
jgi:hypothetical protein